MDIGEIETEFKLKENQYQNVNKKILETIKVIKINDKIQIFLDFPYSWGVEIDLNKNTFEVSELDGG